MSKKPFTAAVAARIHRRNSVRPCSVESCGALRRPTSRYCESHYRQNRRLGHPQAKAVPLTAVEPYFSIADEFIERQLNYGHSGTLAALDQLDELLGLGHQKLQQYNANPEAVWVGHLDEVLAFLATYNISPREALIRIVAVVFFAFHEKPANWDGVVLFRQCARFVMRITRRALRETNGVLPFHRALGDAIHSRLKYYVAAVYSHAASTMRQDESLKAKLCTPIVPNPRGGL